MDPIVAQQYSYEGEPVSTADAYAVICEDSIVGMYTPKKVFFSMCTFHTKAWNNISVVL